MREGGIYGPRPFLLSTRVVALVWVQERREIESFSFATSIATKSLSREARELALFCAFLPSSNWLSPRERLGSVRGPS